MKTNYRIPSSALDSVHDNSLELPITNDTNSRDNYYVNNAMELEDRTWKLTIDSVNINTCATKYQARIQIDKVPINVLRNVPVFYICEQCGQVYWSGSHLERTLNHTIKDIISK